MISYSNIEILFPCGHVYYWFPKMKNVVYNMCMS